MTASAPPSNATTAALLVDLRDALGPDAVSDDPLELALHASDAGTSAGRAGALCRPATADELVAAVRIAARHETPFVARGSGTGLAGGATPLDGSLVISTARLDRLLAVDGDARVAWVEPGVLNLDLSHAVAHLGLHYAPDPSSQQACSIGGNVATNAGGPHCLAAGVTAAHVLAAEVVLPDGSLAVLGGTTPDRPGFDLRGAFVGSEGTMGIATRIAVRLTPIPPSVDTLLLAFDDVADAAATVSAVIAAGVVPSALEMMDAEITRAVEAFVGAGYPRDAAAVLLVEVDGPPDTVAAETADVIRIAHEHGAASVRVAADAAERALLWKGRKSAFGAIARVAPDYYLHDAVVPRSRLVDVLARVYEIVREQQVTTMNVFHAGDGNLHPLLAFDRRVPGVWERVLDAGTAILEACLDAGGVLSGEHGVGLEKRALMPLLFSADDLDAQARVRDAFDPAGRSNPGKVLPAGSRCGEWRDRAVDDDRDGDGDRPRPGAPPRAPRPRADHDAAARDLAALVDAVVAADVVVPTGSGTHWGIGGPAPAGDRVRAPSRVVRHDPADLTVSVDAGTTVADLDHALAAAGQECPLDPRDPRATVGGVVASGLSGHRRLRHGPLRDALLQVWFVTGTGRLVRGGGPTVKNVTGYDLPRLLVGTLGTLGVLGRVTLRCRPRAEVAAWFVGDDDPERIRRALLRPSSLLWDGARTHVLLEGRAAEVEQGADVAGLRPAGGPPPWPEGPHRGRMSVPPGALGAVGPVLDGVRWLGEVGVGTVHVAADDAAALARARLAAHAVGGWLLVEVGGDGLDPWGEAPPAADVHARLRAAFDPDGRCNPGRVPW